MTLMKSACLTLAIAGCLALSQRADAAMVGHYSAANAPSLCQAFTPGPANTIRNRVVGAENVGTATMNVACTFQKTSSQNAGVPTSVSLFFSNNGVDPITVNCTMLTGWQGWSGAKTLNKSVSVSSGVQNVITFSPSDTSDPADTNLGSTLIGVNCSLPPHGVINDTYLNWQEEDGIGT